MTKHINLPYPLYLKKKYSSAVPFCETTCVSDSAFAVVRVSAASSGTGTPGESPMKNPQMHRDEMDRRENA